MATLSGTSTDAEVWAAYDDNASYEEDGSRVKAVRFITACVILLRRTPSRSAFGSRSAQNIIEFDPVRISSELEAARAWVVRNPATTYARTRFASFEDFRDDTSGGEDD